MPSIPIYNHLKKVCESDGAFAGLVNQEHKNLIKCFSYVYEQVRTAVAKGGQSVWVADDVVYRMSEVYYRLDDAEIERRKDEEKKKREAEAAKAKAERDKQGATKKAVQKSDNLAEGQISLGIDDETEAEEAGAA